MTSTGVLHEMIQWHGPMWWIAWPLWKSDADSCLSRPGRLPRLTTTTWFLVESVARWRHQEWWFPAFGHSHHQPTNTKDDRRNWWTRERGQFSRVMIPSTWPFAWSAHKHYGWPQKLMNKREWTVFTSDDPQHLAIRMASSQTQRMTAKTDEQERVDSFHKWWFPALGHSHGQLTNTKDDRQDWWTRESGQFSSVMIPSTWPFAWPAHKHKRMTAETDEQERVDRFQEWWSPFAIRLISPGHTEIQRLRFKLKPETSPQADLLWHINCLPQTITLGGFVILT